METKSDKNDSENKANSETDKDNKILEFSDIRKTLPPTM